MAAAFSGMGILVGHMAGGSSFTGLLLIMAAGFSWGVANIIMKRVGRVNMAAFVIWTCVVPPVPLFLLSLCVESGQLQALRKLTPTGMGAIVYTGVVSTVIGYGIWGRLLGRYSANMVAPFSLLVPIFGMISASLVLGEAFTPVEALASMLVFSGLVLIVFGDRLHQLIFKTTAVKRTEAGSCVPE